MAVTVPSERRKTGLASLAASYRLGLTVVAPRSRWIASLAGITAIMAVQLLIVKSSDLESDESVVAAAFSLLSFIIPIFCVSNATNAFGSAVNNDTLIYPWLRPVPRWQLALGFTAAVWSLMLSAVVVSALVLIPFGAPLDLVLGLMVSGGLGVIAYSAVFTALGARFKRASVIGLVYVVLIDSFFSNLNQAMARISIRSYTTAVLSEIVDSAGLSAIVDDVGTARFATGMGPSVLILGVITALGVGLTVLFLKRADVA